MLPFLFTEVSLKKKTTIIYYKGGAYGTFMEWCLNYFTDLKFTDPLPFVKNTGSAHNFLGNPLFIHGQFESYTASDVENQFVRLHPGDTSTSACQLSETPESYGKLLDLELTIFNEKYQSCIFLYYSTKSLVWGINNEISKIRVELNDYKEEYLAYLDGKSDKLLDILAAANTRTDYSQLLLCVEELVTSVNNFKGTLQQWNKNSISEFAPWEIREFLSLALYKTLLDSCDPLIFDNAKEKFTGILFIEISELRDNFKHTLINIINKLNLNIVNADKINFIYQQWIELQIHKDKDLLVDTIVESLIKQVDFDWSTANITFLDEVFIQHSLRENNIEIKCCELNNFPTNTKDFIPLLERS